MRTRGHSGWQTLAAHTMLGALAGMLLLHPVTKAIYSAEWSGAKSELARLALAFSPRMAGMTAAFAVLGAALGLAFGLYDRLAARRRRVLDFLEAELERTVPSLIAAGESEHVEFKASARWDLERGCASRQLEDAVVRTIAGLLNHTGGSLIIGVTDERAASGLERDYRTLKDPNRDGFERFIIGLVRSRLGGDICPLVHVTFHSLDGHDICRVIVEPADRPVYFHDGATSHLFVRTGNSTRELDVQEAMLHAARRFPARRANRARGLVALLAILPACGGARDDSTLDTSGATAMRTAAESAVAVIGAEPSSITPAQVALGDSIFHGQVANSICYTCHGPEAKGTLTIAPDLTDPIWLHGDGSYGAIVATITAGVPKPKESSAPMAPMGGPPLTAEQIMAVAAYVYRLSHPAVR